MTSADRTVAIGLDGEAESVVQSGFQFSVELNATKLALWQGQDYIGAILKLTKLDHGIVPTQSRNYIELAALDRQPFSRVARTIERSRNPNGAIFKTARNPPPRCPLFN